MSGGYNSLIGGSILRETVEFVCSSCRHLVAETAIYCWQCGVKLEQSNLVEHYDLVGKKLTEEEFQERRIVCHN